MSEGQTRLARSCTVLSVHRFSTNATTRHKNHPRLLTSKTVRLQRKTRIGHKHASFSCTTSAGKIFAPINSELLSGYAQDVSSTCSCKVSVAFVRQLPKFYLLDQLPVEVSYMELQRNLSNSFGGDIRYKQTDGRTLHMRHFYFVRDI